MSSSSHVSDAPVTGWWHPANWLEVGRWGLVACLVATVLLSSVAVFSGADHGNASIGQASGLLVAHQGFGHVWWVFRRNLLVLGIHLCACWIGAIVGRRHEPTPEHWGRAVGALNRPVPAWMARVSLYYALAVTLLSVAVQSIALGRELADLAAATDLSRLHLLWLVLPHAGPELVAVFLPLGLFLLEARRGRLDRLGAWSLEAAAVALPILLCAAAVETYVTPSRIIAAEQHATSNHLAKPARS